MGTKVWIEKTSNGMTARRSLVKYTVLDALTSELGIEENVPKPDISIEGLGWRMSGTKVAVHAESILNGGTMASGAIKFTLLFQSANDSDREWTIAEGVIADGLDIGMGAMLREISFEGEINVDFPSGDYVPIIRVQELFWGGAQQRTEWLKVPNASKRYKKITWKSQKDKLAEEEENRKKANAIVRKDGKAAQSYKPVKLQVDGVHWSMKDGKATISVDKIRNMSTWKAGALKLSLWYCVKPFDPEHSSDNTYYKMAEGIVSPDALSEEVGKDFFDHPKVVGDVFGDPPTGDYYSVVYVYEYQSDGSWNWRSRTWFNSKTNHWNNRVEARQREEEERKRQEEARERELSRRTTTTYGLPPADVRQRLFDAIAEAYQAAKENLPKAPPLDMNVLFAGTPLWSGDATTGLDFPIGVQEEDGTPLIMEIGDKNPHCLCGGTSGSGKTVLLHAIIHSLCWKYSPAELELHLLDFKNGVGFRPYSNADESAPWLPHAKTIATHNDPAYALSVFDELANEFKRRSMLFKRLQAVDYKNYREKGGKLPRVLVLVDEFQAIFGGAESDVIEARLLSGVKQWRAAGIHLLLSTQGLNGVEINNRSSLVSQLKVRLALNGGASDGILDSDNDAATRISKPMCIYNDSLGTKSANRLFKVPFVKFDSDAETEFHRRIDEAADEKGFSRDGRVFKGSELPRRPSDADLLDGAPDTTGFAIRIGIRNDYLGRPAFLVLADRASGHFLAAAPDGDEDLDDAGNLTCNAVWNGLFDTVLASLSATPETEVLLYDPLAKARPASLPGGWAFLGRGVGEETLCDALKALAQSPALHRVLVVRDWENATRLHPRTESAPLSVRTETEDDTIHRILSGSSGFGGGSSNETARSVFASAFSSASDSRPFHAVLFVRNFSSARRETFGDGSILRNCSQRVAVNLSEGDLGTLFPDMKMRGTTHGIFAGKADANEPFRFLPFRPEEEGKDEP